MSIDAAPSASVRYAPGPKGHPILGSTPDMRRDVLKLFADSFRDYGDIVRLKLVQRIHVVYHPDYVKHVLQDNHMNYTKGWIYSRVKALVGNGLLTSEGDFWRRQRRLAQPAFHRPRIAGFASKMAEHTDRMLERWESAAQRGVEIDIHHEMMRLTLAIVGQALFSMDLSANADRVDRALSTALDIFSDRMSALLLIPGLPTPKNLRFNRAKAELDAVVDEIIVGRRSQPAEHHDLLAMLMEAKDEETGEAMDDRQLRDEVLTMVLAGHETTANALAFTCYLLSRHPEIERRVHEEVDRALAGRTPTLEDLPNLPYTLQVIEEAMRLYPPAYAFSRKAIQDDCIGGYQIAAGSTVIIGAFMVHRHPGFWENPEGFDPDRFAPDRVTARHRYAYVPFAGGPRQCIGNHFALMEAQIIVAMIVQRFHLALEPGYRLEFDPSLTLRPRHGVPMKVQARTSV